MSVLRSRLALSALRPFVPKGDNVPQRRVKSMTYVVSPTSGDESWRVASGAARGSKLDHTTLRAEALATGFDRPGFVGETFQMLFPGSAQ